ncbi:FAD/FMN-containing isoamyl alcohol oxidase MreA-like protein [Aspergillus nomiae NRRL 13137]|uniref:FAD/FMN-containing isoamyl alcohol oxidase MreA-like protein n=1 Tax=Aspergillus nomiae NRRL (strain ATCC 15546 / NRRL 13137 / CBS 260.88 / M93) TaxID=1509407 RepID=A0A0L1IPM8_ASPN3|nr:FAD/FMN-containing isoamyl alcohol oxidase MreA-like protein [Aspergillus nomiae NRRL 13137]KNG81506.1 FAD/FMN-containing isoamyl alcohol oxidase MreA-like protein [Aspergillus nomiae NRRL 13137]
MKSLIWALPFIPLAYGNSNSSSCRCQPHQSCWPSEQEWNSLNSTINGNLVAVRPIAAVCHEGGRNSSACKEVTAAWTNSTWRAAQPGAVQWENWESWPEHNETCYIESPRNMPCGQGQISLYSTLAKSAFDIQETVKFAKQYNLRLVVKNSGHDFLGRASAPGSLQILTNGMKDIKIVDKFTPAVTIAAGVSLQELYAAVAARNRTVVAGTSHTVGAAGGYIQGGGHSALGPWKGMASDNALEFTIGTANGELVVANEYQNKDLFWALRGGGGGTFGVVVSVTVRTFDDAPLILTNLNITTSVGNPQYWDALTDFHASLPRINDAKGAGYYWMVPDIKLSENTSVSTLTQVSSSPIKQTQHRLTYASYAIPSVGFIFSNIFLTGSSDQTGGVSLLGSRLFSRDLLSSNNGSRKLTSALRSIRVDPGSAILGHLVAGGAVANNAGKVDSALNPAWRKAITHIVIPRGWEPNATLAEQEAVKRNLTDVEVPILRSVEGDEKMGAYLNEANAYESEFQGSFWGENYRRLLEIKKKWDPESLFVVRRGVGSEGWDEWGLCRVEK